MKHSYDSIYLSPHLDDAVLSCGGQIYQQTQSGAQVLVVTVAAGQPKTDVRSTFAQFLHHNWGFTAEEGVAARREEDVEACARLGADVYHWSLPDCIYRLHPDEGAPLYTSNEDIFGPVHPAEMILLGQLENFFATLPAASRILAPLTAGNHVDHQLVRMAAEHCWGNDLWYYEDYPYVQRDAGELDCLIQPARQWRAQLIPISPAALQARIEATSAYRSQIKTLFNSKEEMIDAINAQVSAAGGERLWYRTSSPGSS